MRIESLEEVLTVVKSRPARLGRVRLVAVDGHAGGGKTTFAERLRRVAAHGGDRVALLHTDDLYEGWGHPTDFGARLRDWILRPLLAGEPGRYRVFNWTENRFESVWHTIENPEILIMEGVSTSDSNWRPLLSFSVFVTADRALRLQRGLDRDGEGLREEWLAWQEAEDAHFAADATPDHADLLVDGAPQVPHDPEVEFVVID